MTDNFANADRALTAMAAVGYQDPAETIGLTIETPDGTHEPGPEGYPISDLIADLLHLALRHRLPLGEVLRRAIRDVAADVIEQAWENDESTPACQQDCSPEWARTLLRAAGIPPSIGIGVDREALRGLGIGDNG